MQIMVESYAGWQIGKVFPLGESEKGFSTATKRSF